MHERGFNAWYLSRIANPRTVFDIGVGNGTYALYEAFPDARFILVEPVREYARVIDEISSKYDCRVYYNAVGAVPGRLEFQVDTTDPEKSSFESREQLTVRDHEIEKREIEVITLDSILCDLQEIEKPVLVKIDTEGHEISALRGATRLLEITDMVIAEVSVARRFVGGYSFEDMILFMKDHGFQVADILAIAHADGELKPRHMDVVFIRSDASA
ncbi:MAG TPA: FkbM family methyltransferase [Longimicrobiales bacterium]